MVGRMRPFFMALVFMMLAVAASISPVFAGDSFPSKPVHILVPFSAGGAVDIVARTLGDELGKRWGQSIVVENRPGAGGTIASLAVAKAPPDGHTLIVVASGHAIVPFLFQKLAYDIFTDFTPITLLANSPNMVLVRADSPLISFADLLALARQKPGQLAYGHAGNGTSSHLAAELLKAMARIDIVSIPYKGGAPALNDLMGGHIALSFNNIPESIGQVQAGAIRPLAVTSAARSPILPDVPTIAESGVPGYDTGVWWGVLAPAGLPADVVVKLNRDCVDAMNAPAAAGRLRELGATPVGSSSQAFGAVIRADYEKWGPIIKAAGIQGE